MTEPLHNFGDQDLFELRLGFPSPNDLHFVVRMDSRVPELPTNVSRIYRHFVFRPPKHIRHIKYVALNILVNGESRARSDFLELRIFGPPSQRNLEGVSIRQFQGMSRAC